MFVISGGERANLVVDSTDQATLDADLAAVRQGDRDRYHGVVMACQDAVRRFLAARLASTSDVEELLQTTFITAYAQLDRFDPAKGRFVAWLVGIAHNHLRHHLRQRARSPEIGIDGLDALIAANLDPEDQVGDRRLEALRVCLEELPERSRALLAQRYGSDEGLARLAQRFSQGQQALAALLLRLRRRLRTCIDGRSA